MVLFWIRTVYMMCSQKSPYQYDEDLYDKYKAVFDDYITSVVSTIIYDSNRYDKIQCIYL